MSKNLQDVLRLALSCQGDEEGNSVEGARTMTEEDRKFVEEALKSMTVDVVDLLRSALTTLNNAEATTDDKVNALNTIRDQIDNLDFANSFIKIGGGRMLLIYMKSEQQELRKLAIYIVAEMSQNNTYCQAYFLQNEAMPLLLNNITESEEIATSSLHAVSALISNNEKGIDELLRYDAVPKLLWLLDTQHPRIFIKTCFLIDNLAKQSKAAMEQFTKKDALMILLAHLEPITQFDIKSETLLGAIYTLSKSRILSLPVKKLKEIRAMMADIIARNEELPECDEIVQYAHGINYNLGQLMHRTQEKNQQLMLVE